MGSEGFNYHFTVVEVYGAAHLVFPRLRTTVHVDIIKGDDTGYIHVPPFNTLNVTATSFFHRINVTWAPFIYENATWILPTGKNVNLSDFLKLF